MGETYHAARAQNVRGRTFSILERIDVGETSRSGRLPRNNTPPFSILERIDVGETIPGFGRGA